ncbi:hypothetical protein ACVWWO_007236 [Bradyrhizobium sp. F1.13.1]
MDASLPAHMRPERSFQGFILALQRFWAEQGCVILQPYDMEMGAGTFHPATTLRALGPKPWNAAYVQPFFFFFFLRADPRTAATARIRTGCSTTTSSR